MIVLGSGKAAYPCLVIETLAGQPCSQGSQETEEQLTSKTEVGNEVVLWSCTCFVF